MMLFHKVKAMYGTVFPITKLPRSLSTILFSAVVAMSFAQSLQAEDDACHITTSFNIAPTDFSFGPYDMSFTPAFFIGDATFLTLFDLTVAGEIKPRLAKSWQSNKANNKLVIELDERCRWSDGAEITAKDMADGIRLMYTRTDAFVAGREYIGSGVEILKGEAALADLGVREIGRNSLEIDYVGSKDLLMKALSAPFYTPVPNHLIDDGRAIWPSKELLPVVSGAYIGAVESGGDRKISLTKNPYYCSHIPVSMPTVNVHTNLHQRGIIREFVSKKIDVATRLTSRHMHTLESRNVEDESYTIGTRAALANTTVYYLFINQLKPELADPRVKSAIRLAIDHELYLSAAMLGNLSKRMTSYTPRYGQYAPKDFDFGSDDYQQRIEEAKALMTDAGYSEENPLVIDLLLRQNHYLSQMAEALAAMLKQVYIKPEFIVTGEGAQYYHNLDVGDFGLGFFVWVGDFPDPSNYLTGILDKRFIDEAIHADLKDKLIESGKIRDLGERYNLLSDLEAELEKLGHIIPLYSINRGWAIRKPYEFGELVSLSVRNIYSDDCLRKAVVNN